MIPIVHTISYVSNQRNNITNCKNIEHARRPIYLKDLNIMRNEAEEAASTTALTEMRVDKEHASAK